MGRIENLNGIFFAFHPVHPNILLFFLVIQLVVKDLLETQAMSWGCHGCLGAVFRGEDGGDGVGIEFAAAGVGEGSSEVANHLVEEMISDDVELISARLSEWGDADGLQSANGASVPDAARVAKGGKVVGAE